MAKRRTQCKLAEQVGVRIRFLRLEAGWTLRTLAERAECSVSGLHAIEMGRSMIHIRTLYRIAQALHIEPFELLNVDPESNDVAYIVEKMRQDEWVAGLVRACLSKGGLRQQTN